MEAAGAIACDRERIGSLVFKKKIRDKNSAGGEKKMNRTKKIILSLTLLLALSMVVGAAYGAAAKGKQLLSWSTGTTSGSMYPIGVAMSSVINEKAADRFNITIEVSAGAVENARNIASEASDIGFVSSSTAMTALTGTAGFAGKPLDFKMLMATYTQPLHLVVLADSSIQTLADAAGKRIVVGPPGSANLTENTFALTALGYDINKDFKPLNIAVADGIDYLIDGDADILMFVGGLPVSGLMDLVTRSKVRVLSFTPKEIDLLLNNADPKCFTSAIIPANTYAGIDYDVQTVSVNMLIGVCSSMPDDVAYDLVAEVMKNLEEMKGLHKAIKEIQTETVYPANFSQYLHKGAYQYYKDNNLIH